MKTIGRADYSSASGAVQDMSIDHGRLHIPVPEQFLDGPDVVARHQKMCGEAVPEGVAAHPLRYPNIPSGISDGSPNDRLV